jgi:hypothetical protein
MSFGIWSVTGHAWVRSVLGGILRYSTIESAERVLNDQRLVYPECEWAVYYIGEDDQPYMPDGSVVIKPLW